MRRIVLWGMSTLTMVVLLFSYSTSRSSQPLAAGTAVVRSTTGTGGSTGGDSSSSGGSSSSSSSTSASQTYAGDAVMTRYGAVQVQITVEGGQVTAAEVLQVPWSDRHDQMINSRAVPVYNAEVVDAQSADIDVVSGATVTWQGYVGSLQSALDQAHL